MSLDQPTSPLGRAATGEVLQFTGMLTALSSSGTSWTAPSARSSLPAKPEGFTRHLQMHMNFGRGKGAGLYHVRDPEGRLMPFGYQYDTRPRGLTGFTIEGRDDALTWEQLVAYWPQYLQNKVSSE